MRQSESPGHAAPGRQRRGGAPPRRCGLPPLPDDENGSRPEALLERLNVLLSLTGNGDVPTHVRDIVLKSQSLKHDSQTWHIASVRSLHAIAALYPDTSKAAGPAVR